MKRASWGFVALYELVKGKPQPTEQATDEEKALYDEATGAVAALAGLVQEEPADVKQLSALRALASQDARTISVQSLTSVFEAPYWQEHVNNSGLTEESTTARLASTAPWTMETTR